MKPMTIYSLLTLLLVLTLLLSGCGAAVQVPSNYAPPLLGQVYYIHPGTVMRGLQACVASLEGTGIYTDGVRYVFVWANNGLNTVSFIGFAKNGQAVDLSDMVKAGGNLINSKQVKEVLDALVQSGYSKVDPATLPFVVTSLGLRMLSAPVLIFSTAVVDGDIDAWFEDTFLPVQEDL